MSNDLIEKRDERTRRRKIVKRKMDSIIGLSYHDKDKKVMTLSADAMKLSDNKARLLDEGYIDNGFVIKKGTLEKYLNGQNQYVRGYEFNGEEWEQTEVLNLTSDFEGTVNLGHIDFATLPINLGYWSKEDLTLVDIDNDRKALDVALHLDEESVIIKELKRQPFDIGISAEFWVHENVEDTKNLSEMLGYYLPVFDEIFIFAYGLVGECGNVNSSGLELKKETEMPNEKEMLALETEAVEVEEPIAEEELSIAEAEVEIAPTEEESEALTEEIGLETEEEVEAEEETEEAEDGEEAIVEEAEEEESEGDEDESDEADGLAEVLSIVESLKAEVERLNDTIATLTETNAELKKSNRKLQKKLKVEGEKKEAFLASAKDIAIELLPNEKLKTEEKFADRNYLYGDGIGD